MITHLSSMDHSTPSTYKHYQVALKQRIVYVLKYRPCYQGAFLKYLLSSKMKLNWPTYLSIYPLNWCQVYQNVMGN